MRSEIPATPLESTLFSCRMCGGPLLSAHVLMGVCSWCIASDRPGRVVRSPQYGMKHGKQRKQEVPQPE